MQIPGVLAQYDLTVMSADFTFKVEQETTADYAVPTEFAGRRALLKIDPSRPNGCGMSVDTSCGVLMIRRIHFRDSSAPRPESQWCVGLETTVCRIVASSTTSSRGSADRPPHPLGRPVVRLGNSPIATMLVRCATPGTAQPYTWAADGPSSAASPPGTARSPVHRPREAVSAPARRCHCPRARRSEPPWIPPRNWGDEIDGSRWAKIAPGDPETCRRRWLGFVPWDHIPGR